MNTPTMIINPTINRDIHIGDVYNALLSCIYTKQKKGKLYLCVEDLYNNVEFNETISDLRWLGIDNLIVFHQANHSQYYSDYLQKLMNIGKAYRCDCVVTNKRVFYENRYKHVCRDLQAKIESRHVIRFASSFTGTVTINDMLIGPIVIDNDTCDDPILVDEQGRFTKYLTDIIDRHVLGVTHIFQPEDRCISLAIKTQITYLKFNDVLFWNMPLLRNSDRSKISKKKNMCTSISYYKRNYTPAAVTNFLLNMVYLNDISNNPSSFEEMVNAFDFNRITNNNLHGFFDLNLLDRIQRLYTP